MCGSQRSKTASYLQMELFSREWIRQVLFSLVRFCLDLGTQWWSQFCKKTINLLPYPGAWKYFVFLKEDHKEQRLVEIIAQVTLDAGKCVTVTEPGGKCFYLYSWHLKLHKLSFSTEYVPGSVDLQETHVWDFYLRTTVKEILTQGIVLKT